LSARTTESDFVITGAGNVGIGKIPETVLDLQATDNLALRFYNSTSFKAGIQVPTTAGDMIAGSAVNDLAIRSQTNMLFATGGNSERMRISSAGNVGIGTGSPSAKVDIRDIGGRTIQLGKNPTTNYYGSSLYMSVDIGSTEKAFNIGTKYSATGGNLVFEHSTNDMGRNGDASALTYTERMRIDSSGNVGIGNAVASTLNSQSGYAKLAVGTGSGENGATIYSGSNGVLAFANGTSGTSTYKGFMIYAHSDNSMRFGTDATERMRIDSSGNLLVGTTNNSQSAGIGTKIKEWGSVMVVNNSSTGGGDAFSYYSTASNNYKFWVNANGQIAAISTSIQSLSDQRFKENIRDLDDGLSKVMQLKPRKFDWKEGKGSDIKDARGFIAQEFEEVFPDLIGEWKDPAPEGEEPYKSVSQDLIPTLVKAIQEQQTLIESLTDRIAALEE
jgi:hypothetical protein